MNTTPLPSVLIVDDNEDVLLAAKLLLKPYASLVRTTPSPGEIPALLGATAFDVIFLDMNFTSSGTDGQEGFFWLKEILSIDPQAIVVLMTAYGGIETAVRAVKDGAIDFVLKPWQNEKLLATFSSACKLRESRLELERVRSKQKYLNEASIGVAHDIIGNSDAMKKVFSTISKVADTDANVLILGENGTGKELVARALHRNSKRAQDAFVNVDMGSITQSLFESELFGHVKGAFTDAKEDRPGRFEIASGGTLFLDEIGNLPPGLQSKLLSVIQNKEVVRVGSNKPCKTDIRLICATNVRIYDEVAANRFRQDLLYRINTVEIQVPPLRERKGDIPLLVEYYLPIYKQKYNKPGLHVTPHTLSKFEQYAWPGNVRELQHVIERSVILCDSDALEPADVLFGSMHQSPVTPDPHEETTFNLDEIEKTIIKKVLAKFEGNISKAAKELGLTRTSLYRRMEKHGL
ncbi:MAG TPA: sigma-54 dependent transcriptional regulator [Bacteroidota bacterium]|nr:sigma-54 dependent transcriptional regulator [Bacteroidota bacterium]